MVGSLVRVENGGCVAEGAAQQCMLRGAICREESPFPDSGKVFAEGRRARWAWGRRSAEAWVASLQRGGSVGEGAREEEPEEDWSVLLLLFLDYQYIQCRRG